MSGGFDPHEVLAAVRRLEGDLAEMRARARHAGAPSGLDELRRLLAADAARERQRSVEDMEALVDLVGASWRATGDRIAALSGQIAAVAAQVGEIRAMAEEARRAVSGARVELRLGGLAGNGESRADAGRAGRA
jgi:hypothetical protein